MRFVDIDHVELMITKRKIIMTTPEMSRLVNLREAPGHNTLLFDSDHYVAIGCDLRNTPLLDTTMKSIIGCEDSLVLCISEVSLTYMPMEAADELIRWTATLSSGRLDIALS